MAEHWEAENEIERLVQAVMSIFKLNAKDRILLPRTVTSSIAKLRLILTR